MPGTSLPCPTKVSSPPRVSAPAWAAAWRIRISAAAFAAALAGGCQNPGLVDRAIFDARTPVADRESFHKGTRALSKACASALAEEQWDTIAAESKRLELLAQRWDEYPPPETAKVAEHRTHAKALNQAAEALTAAAAKRDLPAASAAYGLAADRVAKLRKLEPPPPLPSPAPPRALPMRETP